MVPTLVDDIDFFKSILADVADEKKRSGGVERESPWVSESIGVNFWLASARNKRIIGWYRVRLPRAQGVNVNAKHLARQHLRILAVPEGIANAAAIT
jgi:hypothetical protein